MISNTIGYGRVERNGALKRKYYGRFGSNGFCFRNDRGRSISSTRKTYKNPEAKGNSRRGLQGRVMHQTNLLNHGGVISNSALKRKFFVDLDFWFFCSSII